MHKFSNKLNIFMVLVIAVPLIVLLVIHLCQGECITYKSDKTRAELYSLYTAVQMFKFDTERYPSPKEGLDALVRQPENTPGWAVGGYLADTSVPKDAWGNEYIYVSQPKLTPPFEIISFGADGVLGGKKEKADLSTRQLIKK